MTKTITVQNQPRLGLSRTFSMTVNGVKYRIFRSAVTVIVIAVAIAFLMNILTESFIKQAVSNETQVRLSEMRSTAIWISRLNSPPSLMGLMETLSRADPEGPAFLEAQTLGGLDSAQIHLLAEKTATLILFTGFLERLDFGRLRLLTQGNQDLRALTHLQSSVNRDQFFSQIADFRGIRSPLSRPEMDQMVETWPEVRQLLESIRSGHRTAITKIRRALDGEPLDQALQYADGRTGELIRNAGFVFPEELAMQISRQARELEMLRMVEQALSESAVRQLIAARLNLLPAELTVNDLWRFTSQRSRAVELSEALGRLEFFVEAPDPDLLMKLGDQRREERRLSQLEGMGASFGGGLFGLGQRMSWLVLLSLVVCVVGITNAMLMSVTERYREIATFKCLGALDGSIMLIFVIEAGLLGSVGGAIGAILGLFLSMIRMFFAYGGLVLDSFPLMTLLISVLGCLVFGVILAAVAAIYPAFKAARLAPMEAMRIE